MAKRKQQPDEPFHYDKEGFGEKPDRRKIAAMLGVMALIVMVGIAIVFNFKP